MASRKEQRERARQERERQEANEQARQRRQRLMQLGTAAVLLAIVAVVAVIIVSQQGGGSSGGSTDVKDVSQVDSELHGLDQQGLTLGDPKAKVTVVEFGDLQCPVCKAYSEQIMPAVIGGPVQSGDAKLEFRNWTIIGPQSKPAAEAALAASEQGRYWSFITLFYRNQGEENSGYVTDAFLEAIAKGAGVPDISKWNQDRQSSKWDSQLAQNDTEAGQLGLTGTPGFLFEGPNGKRKTVASPGSAAAIESAIKAVS